MLKFRQKVYLKYHAFGCNIQAWIENGFTEWHFLHRYFDKKSWITYLSGISIIIIESKSQCIFISSLSTLCMLYNRHDIKINCWLNPFGLILLFELNNELQVYGRQFKKRMILHNVTRFEDITQTQYSSQHCDFPYILHMHECIKSSFQKKIGSKQCANF